MSLLIALLTLSLALFFLNLFFQLAKVEKGMQGTVAQLEKFMVMRYNLKKEGDGAAPGETEGQADAA